MNLFAEDIVLFPREKPNLLPKARSRRIRPHRGGRAGKIGRNEWLGDLRKLTRTMEITHAFIDSYYLRAPHTSIIRIHLFILPKLKNPTELICASCFAPNYTPFPLCPQVLRKKRRNSFISLYAPPLWPKVLSKKPKRIHCASHAFPRNSDLR